MRDLAAAAMVTERAAVAILNQMEAEGIIERKRGGRRNSYTIDYDGFLMFRGWQFERWRIPAELIDVATTGIRMLSSRGDA